ncbi:dUTP diphosphatase [Alkalibacillus aidingensis]|uniref:dUTP diphosphatase n=1 Tax=Alkalibacillus aidingensis TaxID=2747607 RepID=UPI0016607B37|nr:dUTP diphosphatase [Alkalibacillus aidingensis]
MDWNRLYELQEILDNRIIETISKSREDVQGDKYLALMVEISELANETRCFKYWSQKGASEREVILEEYVDGIHFLLSIGIDYDYRFDQEKIDLCTYPTLTEAFHQVYDQIARFKMDPTVTNYNRLMNEYLTVGDMLSFQTDEIVQAYLDKNEENHQRQSQGY